MLKNVKDVQNLKSSPERGAGLKGHIPANDNIGALSDDLLSAFEEPANDNEESDDANSLGLAIPCYNEFCDEAEGYLYDRTEDDIAELDFTTARSSARGFLSE